MSKPERVAVRTIEQVCRELTAVLEARTGMDLDAARTPRLLEAVESFLRGNQIPGAASISALLEDPAQREQALEQLTCQLMVGESFFFRNPEHFRVLAERVLPAITRDRSAQRWIRIWSAGCATGEEPCSIAILLARDFPQLHDWNIKILATDISRRHLERAEARAFPAWSFRGTEIHQDRRYFQRSGERWVLCETVARQIRYRELNLAQDCYPSALTQTLDLDLILFRNVGIYLKRAVNRLILSRFARCLRPGGWLLLGDAEFQQDLYQNNDFELLRDGPVMLLRRRPGRPTEQPA